MTRLVALASGAVLALVLGGCGSDDVAADAPQGAASPATPAAPSSDPTAACSAVLSDDVLAPLAWPDLSPPGESAGRCERTSRTSTLTVGPRPDLVSDGDQERARAAYEAACVGLRRDGSPSPDTDTDWLGDDVTACFRPFPRGHDTGLAELVLLTDDAGVVEVQVAAGTPTREQDLQAALALLVPEAMAAW